jgi:hypothetical protein
MKRHPPFSRRGEQAIQAFQLAAIESAIPRVDPGDEVVYAARARLERARGEQLLTPAEPVTVSSGEAVTWAHKGEAHEAFKGACARIIDTLEQPNSITAGASGDRMSAALGAGVLEPAIDAAISARARNSIEKMLCHQLAAAHHTAMRMVEMSSSPSLQPADIARFAAAAARLMETYQAGCLALLKLKNRGRQRVLVQHVNVGAGGQAVVAGRVDGGSRKRGRSVDNRG